MVYYHDLITGQSWQVLQNWQKEFEFVLIGGWAVWLYTHGLKSKDIDLIVDYVQLEKIRQKYDFSKNDRLKKYETRVNQISIDIYLDYYSDLGIRIRDIRDYTQSVEGFIVPKIELLLILKQTAYMGRKISLKGKKDMIDIISLLQTDDFSWDNYGQLIQQYQLHSYVNSLTELLNSHTEIKELDLNKHHYSQFKRKLLQNLRI